MTVFLIILRRPKTSGAHDGLSLKDTNSSDTIAVKSELVFVREPSDGQKVALQVTVNMHDIKGRIREKLIVHIIWDVPAKMGHGGNPSYIRH